MCVPSDTDATKKSSSPTTTILNAASASRKNSALETGKKLTWRENRQRQIDALNDKVEKLTAAALAEHASALRRSRLPGPHDHDPPPPLDLEYVYAQRKMTTMVAGTPVYQLRSAYAVFSYLLITLAMIVYGMSQISLFATSLSLLTIFLGYDLYSGVLHVVFDHPDNIRLPVLGQPCLEFQWHHKIPDDLVRKDFVDVCGDLNTVALILFFVYGYLLFGPHREGVSGAALVLAGSKLWMGYFGQFSHRSAHSYGKHCPRLAAWLQKRGLMISPRAHLSHHKPPHDTDFCLIGVCNPIVAAMRRVTLNRHAWLAVFLTWSVLDLPAYVAFVEWAARIA
uniref:Lipid desaturase domain-containing protein n=1 Tax=Corethron hystrix TaxID=216773 RepID=A0A6U5EGY9_9STRA|mmetsp:Transcript_17926/g.40722  ORF Transcript_17926/g.40722 Transcript_17926/m.40722 type:complete len:338 (+) Transcript_17926:259-1272(+)